MRGQTNFVFVEGGDQEQVVTSQDVILTVGLNMHKVQSIVSDLQYTQKKRKDNNNGICCCNTMQH